MYGGPVMSIRVIYGTESFLHKNNGNAGQMSEATFDSLADAKAAPLPHGVTFASIDVEGGRHVCTKTLGWEWQPSV
jgi:hypothetical protein